MVTFSPVVASGARPVTHPPSPVRNVWRCIKKEKNGIWRLQTTIELIASQLLWSFASCAKGPVLRYSKWTVITALSVGKIKHTLAYNFVLEYPCIFFGRCICSDCQMSSRSIYHKNKKGVTRSF